ncbi:MAG: GNAT family N-acetyltransferase [Candidatus Hodarchaeales archaeon]
MIAKTYTDVEEFYRMCYNFLARYEAENNLLFGILENLRKNKQYYHPVYEPKLTTVEEKEEIILVSIRTPPYNQLISHTENLESITHLVDKLIEEKAELPGILGFKEGAKLFADLWAKKNNQVMKIKENLRIYKIEEVNPTTLGKDRCEVATEDDIPVLVPFVKNFIEDIFPNASVDYIKREQERVSKSIKEWVRHKSVYILRINNNIVSIVKAGSGTPNGRRINLVYTPTNYRRNGYATELVAWLCNRIINLEGKKYCFLFADLANPTSNKIYMNIGFKAVLDVDEYHFI